MTSTGSQQDVQLGSGEMFDQIAPRYDMLNRIMSLGVDQRWRRATVDALSLSPGSRVLDAATGTGDLALMIARRHPDAHVVGIDPSRGMIAIGQRKAEELGASARVEFQVADVQALPFGSNSFDAASIAFGIRNVGDRRLGLSEMARVTRPGGHVAVLELGEPQGSFLGPLARFHIRQVVPRIGGLLSGSHEYRYLQQSIAAFPAPDVFAQLMQDVGLQVLEVRPLTFGACTLFVAQRSGS